MFLRISEETLLLGLKGTERGHNDERLSSLPVDSTHIGKGDMKTEQNHSKILLALKI